DSHNLMIIGDNDNDMKIAVSELQKCGGGFALVSKGEVLGILPLPIAGLMSDDSVENIIKTQKEILQKAYELGVNEKIDPFITLSFLGLPVIPEIRITDMGTFDVKSFAFL
ncbi:MAG: adenine deaminase C-terminal domain-containing protein, partial [Oscillospiraceae bacterium]